MLVPSVTVLPVVDSGVVSVEDGTSVVPVSVVASVVLPVDSVTVESVGVDPVTVESVGVLSDEIGDDS